MSTAVPDRVRELSDEALVDATRAGDNSAFAELWTRHAPAGRRAALAITRSIDPDDLVSEAFAKTYSAIQRGAGPTDGFRSYLYRAIRNEAVTWGRKRRDVELEYIDEVPDEGVPDQLEELTDRTMLVSAFRTLPEKYRTLLWYLEVEGMKPREVAPLLGLTPNGVSALAVRARDAFRHAWLNAHIADPNRPDECRWVCERLVRGTRRPVARHERRRFDEHLTACAACAMAARDVEHLSSKLRVVLLPLALGSAGAAAYATMGGTSSASAATVAVGTTVAVHSGGLVGVGVAAAAAAVVAVGVIVAAGPSGLPPASAPIADVRPTAAAPPALVESLSVEPVATDPVPSARPTQPVADEGTRAVAGAMSVSGPAGRSSADDPAGGTEEPTPYPFTVASPDMSAPAVLTMRGTGTPGAVVTISDELGGTLAQGAVDANGAFALTVPGDRLRQGMSVTAKHTDPGGAIEYGESTGPLTFPLPVITTGGAVVHLSQVDADADGTIDDAFAVPQGVAGGTVQVTVDGVVHARWMTIGGTSTENFVADIGLGAHQVTLRYVDPTTGIAAPGAVYDAYVAIAME